MAAGSSFRAVSVVAPPPASRKAHEHPFTRQSLRDLQLVHITRVDRNIDMAFWTPWEEKPLDLTKYKETSPIYHPHLYHPYLQMRYVVPQPSPDSLSSASSGYHGSNLASPTLLSFDSAKISRRHEEASQDPEYEAYEQQALQAMAHRNGGTLGSSNPQMRRCVQPNKSEDENYRHQRNKNNLAAKQSRDRRKLREAKLAIRVQYLEGQLAQLKAAAASGCCSRCRQ